MQRYEGRVALVTGAASGIGKATVERLLEEGASIVAVDVQATPEDDRVVAVVGSVADPAVADEAVQTAVDRFGGLDVVANIAGILRTANAHEHSLEMWQQVLDVNLTGTFLVCKAAIPVLLEGGGGSIVNVTSIHEHVPRPGLSLYASAKAALGMLTRSLALELAPEIRVNAVAPGAIVTERNVEAWDLASEIPVGRPGEASEVAGVVSFLLSPDASYVTGASLIVDGGAVLQVLTPAG